MNLLDNLPVCHTMPELRAHIDALDERIVELLARRTALVAQAARIKQDASQIVDTARIEFIVDRVKGHARQLGAPERVAEATYRALIAASIDHERGEFARLRAKE
jgi:isochorismate pyruvate lyase